MKKRMPLLMALVVVLTAVVAVAQEARDTPPGKPEREAAATPRGSEPATAAPAPSDTARGSVPKRLEREAVESLLGETEQPAVEEGARTTTPPGAEEGPAETAAGTEPQPRPSPSRSREPSRSRLPADSAIPQVPSSVERTPATPTAPADEIPTEGLLRQPPPATLDDYRTPEPPPGAEAMDVGAANTLTEEAPDRAPSSSPASAIIIGLIILAILLVALAAVVGVMAAQRTRPLAGAAIAPDTTGWAYLAAPNAPNISLQKTPFFMGSSTDCDLRLADPKASPQHARIDHTEDGHVLTDLNTTNGTYLNGERIASPVSLRPGDEIQMGDIIVTFEVHV